MIDKALMPKWRPTVALSMINGKWSTDSNTENISDGSYDPSP
jgi:hypothetical protein